MRLFIQTRVFAIALAGIFIGACIASSHAAAPNSSSFRSAFLGPEAWEDNLSSTEVRQQLKEHFAQVIEQLETNKASSLLLALQRAEATAVQPWTKAQRRRALIFLAGNRRQQI